MPTARTRATSSFVVDRREFLGFGAGLTSGLWVAGADAAPASGLVETMRGEAFAELKGARRALAVRANVFVEETILTGQAARLSLRFGTDTTLRLGAAARLTIDRYIATPAESSVSWKVASSSIGPASSKAPKASCAACSA